MSCQLDGSNPLDGKVHIPAFSPQKLDLLKTWVGGGLNESRRAGTVGLFILCGRLLGRRVGIGEFCWLACLFILELFQTMQHQQHTRSLARP